MKTRSRVRCGIDTGGTFTDLVAVDETTGRLSVGKFPSTPKRPGQAINGVMKEADLPGRNIESVVLGTTLGLNAVLERKGARVLFLTTRGFEDVLFIQRMNRRYHYSFKWVKPRPLVERCNCIGVEERINARGHVLTSLCEEELERIAERIGSKLKEYSGQSLSIAVCFLFSYLNPTHELLLKAFLSKRYSQVPISLSHEVAPVWREYERSSTVVIDAFVKPILADYLKDVDDSIRRLGATTRWTIMKSNGGHASAEAVRKQPVSTVLSGLSGGVIGARYFGTLANENNLVTLDIGGTSCDVGLIQDGALSQVGHYEFEGGIPVSAPLLDVSSIGAGGGSIAWVDKGGFLKVGPQSAGASPGPACYDQGGTDPTVTDANLVLGRLNANYFLGGKMKLNIRRAKAAVQQLAATLRLDFATAAQAIVDVAEENIANAIRVISVDRGLDPRDFALVACGGAGPLHAGGLAEKVGMRRIVVPLYPGLCSAFGTLIADFKVDKTQSQYFRSTDVKALTVDKIFRAMVEDSLREVCAEGYRGRPRVERWISMRYAGQNYEHDVRVESAAIHAKELQRIFERFHLLHKRFYGYSIGAEVIELIRFKVSTVGKRPQLRLQDLAKGKPIGPELKRKVYLPDKGFAACPIYDRDKLTSGVSLKGPAILEEMDSTIFLRPDHNLNVNRKGVITITL